MDEDDDDEAAAALDAPAASQDPVPAEKPIEPSSFDPKVDSTHAESSPQPSS